MYVGCMFYCVVMECHITERYSTIRSSLLHRQYIQRRVGYIDILFMYVELCLFISKMSNQ